MVTTRSNSTLLIEHATLKKELKDEYDKLIEKFKYGQPISKIVHRQIALVDHLLNHVWHSHIQHNELALVAVGGYGRGELLLHSDIDLLIITNPRLKQAHQHQIERFITALWDIGLEVQHSVRSVKICQREAKKDLSVVTNMMEARLICGSSTHYQAMCDIISTDHIWPIDKFLDAKRLEQAVRYQKYDDTAHKLEPNIKESPGGLRDIQMISWIARRHFGTSNIRQLIKHRLLTRDEYNSLMNATQLLWKIRFSLHHLSSRREDRLLFDLQSDVAKQLGFSCKRKYVNKHIEEFMKMYFKTTAEVYCLNNMLLQNFTEDIINRNQKTIPLNRHFHTLNNYIGSNSKAIFKRQPSTLLEIFLIMQNNPDIIGIRADTIRQIRQNLHLIDAAFRKNIHNRSLFITIIKTSINNDQCLSLMHIHGVLGAYMPIFTAIEGLMQFDMFHVYTVDKHIIKVIKNMHQMGMEKYKDRFLPCHDVFDQLSKPELLYIAGLFHDIAKGRHGDHSLLGAEDALVFCRNHLLNDHEAQLVAWLVKYHLLMSRTAQSKNIDDIEVIQQFADQVKHIDRLNYLYSLTIADIQGTNPTLWNYWRGTLLAKLYQNTLKLLKHGKIALNRQYIQEPQQNAIALLAQRNITAKTAKQVWKQFSAEYFLNHQSEEIAYQTAEVILHQQSHFGEPLVVVKCGVKKGYSQLFMLLKDRQHIFVNTTHALETLSLDVYDARIIQGHQGYTISTYIILEKDGKLIKTKARAQEIKKTILNALTNSNIYNQPKFRRRKKIDSFSIPTEVSFSHHKRHTIMKVSTLNYIGLLSKIGMAMELCGNIFIRRAKISTYGERVEDVFFICNEQKQNISNPITLECLATTIHRTLSQ